MSVYIIRAGEHGPVKIGYSDGPVEKRIRQLQNNHYEILTLIRIIEGGLETERLYHKKYKELHIRGEWFHWSDDMLTRDIHSARIRPEHTEILRLVKTTNLSFASIAKMYNLSRERIRQIASHYGFSGKTRVSTFAENA